MITLYHGNHTDKSRTAYLAHRRQINTEIRSINVSSFTEAELIQALESTSLIDATFIVCAEGLLKAVKKKPKALEFVLSQLARHASSVEILLWEDTQITDTVIKKLGTHCTVRSFMIPVLIFQFLDSIRPGNALQLLILANDCWKSEEPELMFAMLVKRIRVLYAVSGGLKPNDIAGWQLNRLTSQAKFFTMDKLLHCYTSLKIIDIAVKTGTSPFSLKEHIEMFIINSL